MSPPPSALPAGGDERRTDQPGEPRVEPYGRDEEECGDAREGQRASHAVSGDASGVSGSSLVALVLLAVVVAATAACLVSGAQRIGEPFPGFLVAENRTVLSIGRPGWSIESVPRAFFSQVIAVDGRPTTQAAEIQAAIAGLPPRTAVDYRFRKDADIFAATLEVQRFTLDDFVAVYGTYAAVGLAFALAGTWAVWRCARARPLPAAVTAFLVLCLSVGLALGTAGDVYGPYRLVPLYFGAQCVTFAALVHLAVSYPQPIGLGSRWRPVALAVAYAMALLLATGLVRAGDDVALFVPLLYVVYLLLANAIFLYLAALASGLSVEKGGEARARLRRALAGALAAVVLPAVIFLVYPVLERSISPLVLVAPLALFPWLTASALPRRASAEAERRSGSVRLRLSLLFLGAVETSFLIAVAVFWQSNSWAQLLDDATLNLRQHAAVQQVLAAGSAASSADVAVVRRLVQTVPEDELAVAAGAALRRGDAVAAQGALLDLTELYDRVAARLDARRRWIGGLAVPVLLVLLSIAVLQAVAFTVAVGRWLIEPVDRIAAATSVIATGDLAHRAEPERGEEFSRLARAVNAMAASLQAIQRRVELARAARQRAAGTARDAERRRLARELHDGILQDLSVLRMQLDGARGAARSERRPAEAVAAVIAAIRGLVDELRPPALTGVSLEEAIAGHARVLAWAQGVELDLDLSGAAGVPDWAARDLYRIAQEATANALRHAAASRLAIRLVKSGSDTVLEVEDDGVGFDPARTPLGSGLQGMRERAAILGGDVEITRRGARGTLIRLVLHLQAPASPGEPA